ncbi:hypothetical protein CA54_32520 [Symmachiella macrocystis]|uniref:Uncharacterized protein n=1 Tax=Symmachiella macrocystis TaxID=2527985 RepID=A0A5C6BT99_9PLAN|nr:hypothetical protein CA54_32520 [Symmachiella macrocystis]
MIEGRERPVAILVPTPGNVKADAAWKIPVVSRERSGPLHQTERSVLNTAIGRGAWVIQSKGCGDTNLALRSAPHAAPVLTMHV